MEKELNKKQNAEIEGMRKLRFSRFSEILFPEKINGSRSNVEPEITCISSKPAMNRTVKTSILPEIIFILAVVPTSGERRITEKVEHIKAREDAGPMGGKPQRGLNRKPMFRNQPKDTPIARIRTSPRRYLDPLSNPFFNAILGSRCIF